MSRILPPDSVPGGTVIITLRSRRTSPAPWQVGQGCEGIFPLPRQRGQGRLTANPPWPKVTEPRPSHSGQVLTLAPGAAPLPLQVGQDSVTGSVTGTLPPRAAVRNGTSTTASTSGRLSSRRPAAAEDRGEDVAQPAEAAEVEIGEVPGSGARPAALGRRLGFAAGPAPVKAPSRRIWSYFFRLSSSDSTPCASEISLKRSEAAALFGLASGWYCLASLR